MRLFKNTTDSYGVLFKLLHWGMAILVIGLLALGLYMADLPKGPQKFELISWHKEWGITVLLLVILRLSWRFCTSMPALPLTTPLWQKWAAYSVHYALYVLMVLMPITGWLMSSAAGVPVSFFGWFVMPELISPDPMLKKLLAEIHECLAYSLIVAICGHTAAAFFHHFVYKDKILRRML